MTHAPPEQTSPVGQVTPAQGSTSVQALFTHTCPTGQFASTHWSTTTVGAGAGVVSAGGGVPASGPDVPSGKSTTWDPQATAAATNNRAPTLTRFLIFI